MEIKEIKVTDLKTYAGNPRKNDDAVDGVANSIREFGFKVPIVVDRNGEIVAGHTRLKAAKRLGMVKVPCVVADDLTEEQVKAFRLADNKVAEKAEWDFELLESELDDIANFDMTDFGFEFKGSEKNEDKTERKDLSGNVGETFEVVIECDDEAQQESLYYRFVREGLSCHVLTL